ncbi:MAG TPA: penicillin-binding transpeptidase domain-containing protein [Opitutus sp.]|nr:penicillin-binding transpeptidase domain-containing protein [Opitutus sp.]
MATTDTNLAERSGNLVESRRSYDPRIIFFHFVIAALLLTLVGGLAYQQVIKTDIYHERERVQNQRRIFVPGPRGDIYDRDHRLLVGNRPRFAVVLYLDELRGEFDREFRRTRKNYRESGDKDLPTYSQMEQIARATVVQRYLNQINAVLHRNEQVDTNDLRKHFTRQLLLPYTLLDDLAPQDYARLIESLPVRSPLQVYATSARYYPYGSLAAHTLGYVGVDPDIQAEDFPGEDLTTFKMKGTVGRDGLEKEFDAHLEGEPGGSIFRVDPAGYRVNPPLETRLPVQGKDLVTSLDVDLQAAAENAIEQVGGGQSGAAVALDVRTGEVLVLASKPDYNLSDFSPHLSHAAAADIEARQAWMNRAIAAFHPPGSTFKILSAIAGLRAGAITTDQPIVDCEGYLRVAGHIFPCENGRGHHGEILLPEAIAHSCDIYFYTVGIRTTVDVIAAEAHRFHLDQRSGIELPNEPGRAVVPDTAWKERTLDTKWFPGDTANMAIGQGYVLESPINMACFAASLARGETYTKPTLIHRDNAPTQHTEPIGLTPAQRAAILQGMEGCTVYGTANYLTNLESLRVPGVRIAGKTGTAQIPGNKNAAWFICFAPIDHPEIAAAVMIEGDTPGEEVGGGRYAAPIASAILKKYFEKKNRPAPPPLLAPVKSS